MRSLSLLAILGLGLSLAACGDKAPDEDDEGDTTDDSGGGGSFEIDADGDGMPAPDDCNDQDATIYLGAPELCDGLDNDCDALIDNDDYEDLAEGEGTTYYEDSDGDGYGKKGVSRQGCPTPDGFVDNDEDCKDSDADANPAAPELCFDGVDNDCDDLIDEDDAEDAKLWYLDDDRDDYGVDTKTTTACEQPEGFTDNTDDCNDDEASIYPGALEYCDTLDNDCDTLVDEEDPDIDDLRTWYVDADGDRYGVADKTVEACVAPTGYIGNDDDCDDSAADVNPGESEVCDGKDNDCDELADEADSDLIDALEWYADSDEDSYGDVDAVTEACEAPSGYVADDTDCDDEDEDINPGAEELCNGVDMDCDGFTYCEPALGDAGLILTGAAAGDRAGYAVSSAGDFDGDGDSDLLLSGYQNDDGGSNAGAAYVVLSPASGTVSLDDADLILSGEAASDSAGFALASAGDVDKDGYDDVLVGAYQNDGGASNAGATYLVLGPLTGDVSLADADADYTGEAADDRSGFAIAGAGDVDADGYDDILVGAYQSDDGATDGGAVYLIFGDASPGDLSLSSADVAWTGEAADDLAGRAVAGVGDTDADGYADLLIGAPEEDSGAAEAGAAYLILGSTSLSSGSLSGADEMFTGESADDMAGGAVAGAGDFNADGYDDFIIGAEGYALDSKTTLAGATYLYFGPVTSGGSLSGADVILTGEDADDYAGSALAGGEDVDADGYSDIVVGASGDDTTASAAGAAYLVYGPLTSGTHSLADAAATKFVGEVSLDYAGFSVALTGDTDGDGEADVLVGAYGEDSAGSSAGASYLLTEWE